MDSVSLLQVMSTTALNAALAWMAGTLSARYWLRSLRAQWQRPIAAMLDSSETAAACLCLLASGGALWAASAVMAGVPLGEAGAALRLMLARTAYGQAGSVGLLALALIVLFGSRARRLDHFGVAAAALLLAFAASRASISHGGEHGILSPGMGVELLHLVLIALWTGGVAVAGWVVLPGARAQAGHGAALRHYLAALSNAAGLALAGIVASGLYNSWQRVGSVDQLGGSDYGLTLVAKMVLVGIAVCLGGYNKLVGFPAVADGLSTTSRVAALLRLESLCLLGALVAAALLSSQQPPAAL